MGDDRVERISGAAAVIAELARPDLVAALARASDAIVSALRGGGTLLLCGNGGSAADAAHLAAEFVGRCTRERAGLPAICLADSSPVVTALGNDYGYDRVFARQVEAFGRPGDLLVALSTSGRSANCVEALREARARGLTTIGLLGRDGGEMAALCDVALIAPSDVTGRIQECHQVWGHILAEDVDREWA